MAPPTKRRYDTLALTLNSLAFLAIVEFFPKPMKNHYHYHINVCSTTQKCNPESIPTPVGSLHQPFLKMKFNTFTWLTR